MRLHVKLLSIHRQPHGKSVFQGSNETRHLSRQINVVLESCLGFSRVIWTLTHFFVTSHLTPIKIYFLPIKSYQKCYSFCMTYNSSTSNALFHVKKFLPPFLFPASYNLQHSSIVWVSNGKCGRKCRSLGLMVLLLLFWSFYI